MTLCEFEVDGMESLGLVSSNMRPGNDQKMHQNGAFFPRWPTSCWTYGMGPNGVFVRLEMIHKPTEFHSSMSIGKAEVQF